MDGWPSKLRSESAGITPHEQSPVHTLTICSSPTSPIITIDHANHPANAPPLFSIKLSDGMSMSREPDMILSKDGHIIGDASTSLSSSNIKVTLRGHQMEMKQSFSSGDYKLRAPPMQDFKWKSNNLTGSSLELCDPSGHKLARIKKSVQADEQKMEIFVTCDDYFMR